LSTKAHEVASLASHRDDTTMFVTDTAVIR
jgi:hypothetical protein